MYIYYLLYSTICLDSAIVWDSIGYIMIQTKKTDQSECIKCIRSVSDALEVLNGRWKLPILVALKYNNKRFKQISKDIEGITDKMLSKELKELEINQLVKRTVLDTQPITVQYELTEHGNTLQTIITNLTDWGILHRKKIVGK